MSFKRLKFAFLFCAAVCAVFPSVFYAQEDTGVTAETDDNWFYGKLIKSISFKNLKSVDAKELEGVTGSFIGRRFSDEVFGDILDRIYALDFFDEVTPQAIPGDAKKNTVSIVFSVTERPVVTRITFSGNRQIRTTELK